MPGEGRETDYSCRTRKRTSKRQTCRRPISPRSFMHRKFALLSTISTISMLGWTLSLAAQSISDRRPVLTGPIDETKLHTLTGNTRPEATAANDRGLVPDNLAMDHLLLQLQRSPELQKAADQFTEDLQNPKSPSYHHWLTAAEF